MQTVTVDGYSMLLYFHKVAYEGNFIEVLQVTPTKSIYLPFNVVIKVACKGLGGHNLSFFQFYHHQDNAKIYCWSVLVDSKGRPLPNPFEKQKQELLNAAILRQQKAILEAQLAIYEAKRLANLDDEEALLLLL